MTPDERAALPGVAASRARQLLAGAVTAATVMRTLDLAHVDVCPWALREGILLRRIEELTNVGQQHQADVVSIAAKDRAGTSSSASKTRTRAAVDGIAAKGLHRERESGPR